MLVSAKILRRAIVGTVTALGVGTMYLTPSLAGSPEQIAVPVPIETPSETPTPYPSDTETPSPDPYPTGETLAPTTGSTYKAPKPGPTSTYKYVPPKPYVPPKSSTKTTKPPKPSKPTLASVTGLASDSVDTMGFTLKFDSVTDAKKYKVSGCKGSWNTGTSVAMTFPTTGGLAENCSVKVKALATSSGKEGPYSSSLTVLPMLAAPKLNDDFKAPINEPFEVTWDVVPGAKSYAVDNPDKGCTPKDPVVSGTKVSMGVSFNSTTILTCKIVVNADSVKDKYLAGKADSVIITSGPANP